MSSNKKHFKNNIKKSGGGYCPARKNDYFCTRSTEVGPQRRREGFGAQRAGRKKFQKKMVRELEERKKRLLLHPLYRGRASAQGEDQGSTGRKKEIKKRWSRSWRREKNDYLCSPVRRKRENKFERNGSPSGVATTYRKFFDAMAPRGIKFRYLEHRNASRTTARI